MQEPLVTTITREEWQSTREFLDKHETLLINHNCVVANALKQLFNAEDASTSQYYGLVTYTDPNNPLRLKPTKHTALVIQAFDRRQKFPSETDELELSF